jgi:hypothetical protein
MGFAEEARMPQKPPQKPAKPVSAAERREQRLAEALRANLKRRKAARKTDAPKPSGKPDSANE